MKQYQLKISLSQQLHDKLMLRAERLGLPATQFAKHLIISAVEDEVLPTVANSVKTLKENPTEQDINDFLDSIK